MPIIPGTTRTVLSSVDYAATDKGRGLLLRGSTSGSVGIVAPATGSAIKYTLPALPAANGQILTCTTAGVFSFDAGLKYVDSGVLSTLHIGGTNDLVSILQFNTSVNSSSIQAINSGALTLLSDEHLWKTIAGTQLGRLTSSGNMVLGTTLTPTAKLELQPGASVIGLQIKANATPGSYLSLIDSASALVFLIGSDGIADFKDHADTSSSDPTTDAPADWLTVKLAGTEYTIPLYTKA